MDTLGQVLSYALREAMLFDAAPLVVTGIKGSVLCSDTGGPSRDFDAAIIRSAVVMPAIIPAACAAAPAAAAC